MIPSIPPYSNPIVPRREHITFVLVEHTIWDSYMYMTVFINGTMVGECDIASILESLERADEHCVLRSVVYINYTYTRQHVKFPIYTNMIYDHHNSRV